MSILKFENYTKLVSTGITSQTFYNKNWEKETKYNFKYNMSDAYASALKNFTTVIKTTAIKSPTITNINLNFDKTKVSLANIGKLLDVKVTNVVLPKIDLSMTKLNTALLNATQGIGKVAPITGIMTNAARETNNAIAKIKETLDSDLTNSVVKEIKNTEYASNQSFGSLEKMATAPKITLADKTAILEAINANKEAGSLSLTKIQETALNVNTNLKLKASSEIVAAITKLTKMTNQADQILLKNIIDVKLKISPEMEKAIGLNKTTFDAMKLRTDDAGIFLNNFAGDTLKVETTTTNIKSNFEMVYDLKTMSPEKINFLIKEKFISQTEADTKQILSSKEVNGKTLFRALLEYQSKNPNETASNPILSTTLLGPTGPGENIRVTGKGTKITVPGKITEMEFETIKQEPIKTPTETTTLTAQKEISLATYIRQNPTEKAENIQKLFYPEADKYTKANVIANIQSALNNPSENIYEAMERTYLQLDTGKLEINPSGRKTLTKEQKAEQAKTGTLEYATKYGLKEPVKSTTGQLASTDKQKLVASVNATPTSKTTTSSPFVRLLQPGETTKTSKLIEQLTTEKKAEQPETYKDTSITVVRQDVNASNQWNIEGAPPLLNQWLGKVQDWYQPDNENLATKGVLAKTAIVTKGAKVMDVYGSQTKQLNAASALTEMYGPAGMIQTEFKLTPKGEEIRQQVITNKMNGALKLATIEGLDENDQNNLVYEFAFAKTPEAKVQMENEIRNLPNSVLVRDMHTWYGDTIRDVIGDEKIEMAYKDPEVTKNYAKIFEGQSLEKLTKVASEVTSPYITGDPITDFSLFFVTGGIAGETEIAGKLTSKAATKVMEKIANISGDINKVDEFWKYTKEAKIDIPISEYNNNIGDIIGSALLGKTPVASTAIVQVPTMIRIGADAVNPDIATRAINAIGKETKFDSAKTASLLNEQVGTISIATPTSPAMITTRADIRNLVSNAATASTRPEFENAVMQNLETIWENTGKTNKVEPTVKVSTDTSKPTRVSYGVLPTIKMPNSKDIETLKNTALDGDTTTKTIRIPTTNNYPENLQKYIGTNDIYKVPNVGYVKIESVGTDSIRARIATASEVKDAAKKFTWEYMNEDFLGNSIRDNIETKLAALDREKQLLSVTPEETVTTYKGKTTVTTRPLPNKTKIESINTEMKNLETYMTDEEAKIFDISDDMNIDVVDLPEFIAEKEIPLTLGARKADQLEIQLLDIEKLEAEGKKLTITEKELWELPINQETKNVILSKYSHMLLPDTTIDVVKTTTTAALPKMDIGIETPLKGMGLKAVSLPRVIGKAEDLAKLGDRIEAIVLESDDFLKLQKSAPESADIIRKAMSYGDTGNKEIAKLVAESDAWKTLDQTTKEWTTAAVDAKLTKSTGIPSEWTIKKALDDTKNLDYDKAAKTLNTIDPRSARKLKEIREQTKDVSLRQIGELEAHGVDKNIVQELKNARKEEALMELDKKGLSDQMVKLKENRALTSTEVDALWKERDLVQDALYRSEDELKMKTRIFEEKAKDINTRAEKIIDTGTTTEKQALKEERTAFRKAIEDETDRCKKEAPMTGGCSKGAASSKGTKIIGAGALAVALGTATGTTWEYNAKNDTFYEMTLQAEPKEPRTTSISGLPASITKAWNTLMESGIPNRKYQEGNIPGPQGRTIDPTEYICQDYATDAANTLTNKGYNTNAISILGHYTDNNEEIGHTIIGITDESRPYVYTIDPTTGMTWNTKETPNQIATRIKDAYNNPSNYVPLITGNLPTLLKTKPEMALIEPQTGKVYDYGTELIGKKFTKNGREYEIDHATILSGQIKQEQKLQPDKKTLIQTPISTTNQVTSQTDKTSETMKKYTNKFGELIGVSPWMTTGLESKVK